MQRIGVLNGNSNDNDFDYQAGISAILNQGVISGLGVTTNSVAAGSALISVTRGTRTFLIAYENTAAVTISTSGTTKVWIGVDSSKITDNSTGAEDGSGVATIQTGASYPGSGSFIKLASVTGGVITDERTWISERATKKDIIADMRSVAVGQPKDYFTNANASGEHGASVVVEFRPFNNADPGTMGVTLATSTWGHLYTFCWLDTGAMISQYAYGQNEIWARKGTSDTTWGPWQQVYPVVMASKASFGGDGSDGALTGDSDITLSASNNTLVVKNYTSMGIGSTITRPYTNAPTVAAGNNVVFLIADTSPFSVGRYVRVSSSAGSEIAKITAVSTNVSITLDTTTLTHTNSSPLITVLRKLTVSSQNNILVLKFTGNCDLTGWIIDMIGKGGAGGAGGSSAGAIGSTGGTGLTLNLEYAPLGGQGSAYQANTPAPTQQLVAALTNMKPYPYSYAVACGAGGGGGGGSQSQANIVPGGNGGGAVLIECAGTITFPSYSSGAKKVVMVDGNAAVPGAAPGGGASGSGGGGGGTAAFLYKNGISGSPSVSNAGGLGSSGNVSGYFGYSSGAANGGSSIYNIGLIGSGSYNSTSTGGKGGNGGFQAENITYL